MATYVDVVVSSYFYLGLGLSKRLLTGVHCLIRSCLMRRFVDVSFLQANALQGFKGKRCEYAIRTRKSTSARLEHSKVSSPVCMESEPPLINKASARSSPRKIRILFLVGRGGVSNEIGLLADWGNVACGVLWGRLHGPSIPTNIIFAFSRHFHAVLENDFRTTHQLLSKVYRSSGITGCEVFEASLTASRKPGNPYLVSSRIPQPKSPSRSGKGETGAS